MTQRTAAPPPSIPGLTYVDTLGMGGFADVYRYEQLGRRVAVKVLTTDLSHNTQQAFEAEANQMARLSSHPAIVSIFQVGVADDGRSFLVMEVCQAKHLGARLRAKTFAVARALEVTIQVAGAVESAHRLGVLHRDIKPANILFTEFGRPALTDFGISVSRQDGARGVGVGVSPAWAPPEQLRSGTPMTPASDVYSLAVTCWAMLVGRSPFEVPHGSNDALSVAQRVRRDPVPRTRRDDVPESLERVLQMAMAKDPADRYQSALELGRALQAVQTTLQLPTTPMEIGGEQGADDETDEVDDGSTRISHFKVIDPDLPKSGAAPLQSLPGLPRRDHRAADRTDQGMILGVPSAPPAARDFTGPAVPSAIEDHTELKLVEPGTETATATDEGTGPVRVAAPRPARSKFLVPALVLLVLAGAGLALSGVLSQDDVTGTTDNRPASKGGDEPADVIAPAPAEVAGLAVARIGPGKVRATWRNPKPQPDDQFLYRLVDPADMPSYSGPTPALAVTVKAPAGRQCVQVQLVRNGQGSSPTTACTRR